MDRFYTIVLNKKKLQKWIKVRRSNGSKLNMAVLAHKIGYSKSYLSRLINQSKYGRIEVSGRFIGTMLKTFDFDFYEIFDVVKAYDFTGVHPQNRHRERAYDIAIQKHFKRRIGKNYFGF